MYFLVYVSLFFLCVSTFLLSLSPTIIFYFASPLSPSSWNFLLFVSLSFLSLFHSHSFFLFSVFLLNSVCFFSISIFLSLSLSSSLFLCLSISPSLFKIYLSLSLSSFLCLFSSIYFPICLTLSSFL